MRGTRSSRGPAAGSGVFRLLAAAVAIAALAGSAPAVAKTCTRELVEKEFAGPEIAELTCEIVSARLVSLRSEMYYHRWSGEIELRALRSGPDAKIALAAFDGAGNLIGTATFYKRGIDRRPKKFPFRMEGMFTSLADAKKILLSISIPDRAPAE